MMKMHFHFKHWTNVVELWMIWKSIDFQLLIEQCENFSIQSEIKSSRHTSLHCSVMLLVYSLNFITKVKAFQKLTSVWYEEKTIQMFIPYWLSYKRISSITPQVLFKKAFWMLAVINLFNIFAIPKPIFMFGIFEESGSKMNLDDGNLITYGLNKFINSRIFNFSSIYSCYFWCMFFLSSKFSADFAKCASKA